MSENTIGMCVFVYDNTHSRSHPAATMYVLKHKLAARSCMLPTHCQCFSILLVNKKTQFGQ